MKLFEEAFINDIIIPKFVADNYNSLPPDSGFDVIAQHMSRLNDEIEVLTNEIKQLRDYKENYMKEGNANIDIRNEISDIKKMILECEKNSSKLRTNCDEYLQHRKKDDFNSLHPSFLRPESLFPNPTENMHQNSKYLQHRSSYSNALQMGEKKSTHTTRPDLYGRPSQGHANFARGRPMSFVGTKRVTENSGLRGPSPNRIFDIYIGKCWKNTVEKNIIDYCKEECNIDVKSVSALETRSQYYKSFKISVPLLDRDFLLNPNIWPQGIIVRKFFKPKFSHENSQNASNDGCNAVNLRDNLDNSDHYSTPGRS